MYILPFKNRGTLNPLMCTYEVSNELTRLHTTCSFWALKLGEMDEIVIFWHDTGSFPVQYVQTATSMFTVT